MAEIETLETPKTKPHLQAYVKRFKKGRIAAGHSSMTLARGLSITPQSILQFEAGKQRLEIERFVAACDILNLNVRWVLKGRGEMFEEGGPPPRPERKLGRPAKRRAPPSE